MSIKTLVINPGSTSTKVGVFEDETLLFEETPDVGKTYHFTVQEYAVHIQKNRFQCFSFFLLRCAVAPLF